MSKIEPVKTTDGTYLVAEIDRHKKQTRYFNRKESQAKFLTGITLKGFEGIPTGLYLNKNGYGFGRKGNFFLQGIYDHVAGGKPYSLVIDNGKQKRTKKTRSGIEIVLPAEDVKSLLLRLGTINAESNNELREAVGSFLSTRFPNKVKISADHFDGYQKGSLAAALRRKKVVHALSNEDLQELSKFLPDLLEKNFTGARKKQLQSILHGTQGASNRAVLDRVIKQFERLLRANTGEQKWQDFLRDEIIPFISHYVTTIEKQNVSLAVSYPDFVLVTILGFVDAYELKKANTAVLAYDKSHKNYYWTPEIARAISQIENYIEAIVRNQSEFVRSVKKSKGVNIKVVRPRGFIIAGTSDQFKENVEALEDFRMLSVSLKNISFILYDELLEMLKNLRSKI